MLTVLNLLGTFVVDLLKSRRRLKVENLFLRHQLNTALRRAPHRLRVLAQNLQGPREASDFREPAVS